MRPQLTIALLQRLSWIHGIRRLVNETFNAPPRTKEAWLCNEPKPVHSFLFDARTRAAPRADLTRARRYVTPLAVPLTLRKNVRMLVKGVLTLQ